MRTKLLDSAAPRANDQQILAAIEAETESEFGGGGSDYIIGIRNEAGVIYRGIAAEGLGEYVSIETCLREMGLRNEITGESPAREGCDAIFS